MLPPPRSFVSTHGLENSEWLQVAGAPWYLLLCSDIPQPAPTVPLPDTTHTSGHQQQGRNPKTNPESFFWPWHQGHQTSALYGWLSLGFLWRAALPAGCKHCLVLYTLPLPPAGQLCWQEQTLAMARSSFPELLKTRFSFLNSTAQVLRMFFCKVFWEALWKELYCEGVSCPCCALPMAPPAPAGPLILWVTTPT